MRHTLGQPAKCKSPEGPHHDTREDARPVAPTFCATDKRFGAVTCSILNPDAMSGKRLTPTRVRQHCLIESDHPAGESHKLLRRLIPLVALALVTWQQR